MKKFIIGLTILLLCMAGSAFGQAGGCMVPGTNISCLNAYFGVMVGGMWSTMTGDGTTEQGIDVKRRTGLSLGAFFEYPFANNLFVQPEIKYIQKGMKKTHTYDAGEFTRLGKISAVDADGPSDEVTLSYIQIPVLVKYVFPLEGKIKPSIMLGPSLAINLSAKDKASGWGAGWDGDFDIINAKKWEISGVIGAGVAFPVGKLTFGVDVRYDKGFTNVFDDVTQEELNDLGSDETAWTGNNLEGFEAKNGGFGFSASVILPIGAGKSDDDTP
ncbi:MAG: PorT family protein [candidate division Zixibacteria bacterium]|nr:PorT family protein [candidate division Zixibacteria bacterium]MDH3938285.1 PorT family protein [candidate division Zixibacteria bacterium]MDH4034982.1 PorT family protein [candidate division Zixibacteria bacterium]